jgi:hypothetical protein
VIMSRRVLAGVALAAARRALLRHARGGGVFGGRPR